MILIVFSLRSLLRESQSTLADNSSWELYISSEEI